MLATPARSLCPLGAVPRAARPTRERGLRFGAPARIALLGRCASGVVRPVVGAAVATATAATATAAVLLDQLRKPAPTVGAARVDLDRQALVQAAEAAGDPLELRVPVDPEPDPVSGLRLDPEGARVRV